MSGIAIVSLTCPERAGAETIARTLLEQRLIACANIIGPCTSIYRWRDVIEQADEVMMQLKTVPARIPAVIERIAALHPYDLPAIEHWEAGAAPGLIAWIADAVK